jgi:pimeloyl-ACP methyl ester carboxylesterase
MKKTMHLTRFLSLSILALLVSVVQGQQRKIDVGNRSLWQIYDRDLQFTTKDTMGFAPHDSIGLWVLKNEIISLGTVEFDVKGVNDMNNNFVGLAFNMQEDPHVFETIYFRPFNFYNPDTVRRPRSVQYMSLPDNDWFKLRTEHPGKYENRIINAPDPDSWFHVKITINHPEIKVYVNNNPQPSLVVNSLSKYTSGRIGFWIQGKSHGSFANLVITPATAAKKVSYGNNPAAGKYMNAGDAKLYYETYGSGKPILLLHGGVYGYIDEFAAFIDQLSQTNQVICLATRGHGRSEIGNTPFTWDQRAADAYKLIRTITKDSVMVLGFSDGAAAGFKLAANHPEAVSKLVAIGFGDTPKGSRKEKFKYSPELLMSQARSLFEGRKTLMPQPERWAQCLTWLNGLYNNDFLSKETFAKIKCPTLIMSGDKDDYHNVDGIVATAKMIPGSRLSIIPGCSHVVFFCNWPAVWESIKPFFS